VTRTTLVAISFAAALVATSPGLGHSYGTQAPVALEDADVERTVQTYIWAVPLLSPVALAGLLDAGAHPRQVPSPGSMLPSYGAVTTKAVRGVEGMPGAVLLVVAAVALAYLVALLVAHGLTRAVLMVPTRSGQGDRLTRVLRAPMRLVRRLIFGVLSILLSLALLDLAGYEVPAGISRTGLLTWAATSGFRIGVIVLVSWAILRLARTVVEQMSREIAAESGPDAVERVRRVETLGSLLASTLAVIIATSALLMILAELRINVLPLLTGAGIAGLAIGFGAQTLVKDVISGFFLILENQVRVGDAVVINGQGGVVEALTLRTVVLRDVSGAVHIFPNGTITTLANQTKDYSYAVVDVSVGLREDSDRVVAVLTDVTKEMRASSSVAASLLAPLEVLGVESLTETAMTIRVRLKTIPLRQWDVAREFRRRLKKAFDSNGIEAPVAHQVVYLRGDWTPGPAPEAGRA
jgi:small conductance mechanosensitive channel